MSHEMFLAEDFYGKSKNIYMSIMTISTRSRQIAEQQRKEMDAYLSQLEMMEKYEEGEEGMIEESPVPHEPTIRFEKPVILSLREMIADKLKVEGEELMEDDSEDAAKLIEQEKFPAKLSLDDLSEED
ncbi:hypothetical protein K8I28_16135 [bacterium]|nr:hypothetical protein [bacterium]